MIIAHRANVFGPNPQTENSIKSLEFCIKNHIDVELDVWHVDGKFYLGHDEPKYEIDIIKYNFGIINAFLHCKTIETFYELRKHFRFSKQVDLFMHNKDDATVTNNGFIWTYPGKKLFKDSIAVMPEIISQFYLNETRELYKKNMIKGVCTDYIVEWLDETKNLMERKI